MIFYTLQGPNYKLEIHDDKIKLIRKGWLSFFNRKDAIQTWELNQLAQFQVSVPKFIWGKLEWNTFEGKKNTFRFTTNAAMVAKIEKYLQKLIVKNYQKKNNIVALPTKKSKKAHKEKVLAA